jgi:hypothetical protein
VDFLQVEVQVLPRVGLFRFKEEPNIVLRVQYLQLLPALNVKIHNVAKPHNESGKLRFSHEKSLFQDYWISPIDSTGQTTYVTTVPDFHFILR